MKKKANAEGNGLRARVAELRGDYERALGSLVEIPSVSMDPERRADVDRCAEVAASLLRDIGAEVDIIQTAGLPLLLGRVVRDPSFPTVTIYNHLDVQPADPAAWSSPPFTFTRDGDRWRGRGTTDDKGPALATLFGAGMALEDDLRLNLQFLWEMEEEIGSPSFADALGKLVKGGLRTDSVVVSDTIWSAAGRPAIPYGLRGLMGFCVRLQTGDKDVHSGTTGGAARNPITELCALVDDCVDAHSGRVKIPGFYDAVRRLRPSERRSLAQSGFSRRRFQAAHGLRSVRFREDARLAEAIMAAPTFEVHGIVGGYTGAGIKTIVPHFAEAKLSCRLVPDQRPAKVFRLVKDFIRQKCPDAEVIPESSLEPYAADPHGPHHEAAVQAMAAAFGRAPALTREGGSIGAVVTMDKLLRAPIVLLGLSLPEHGYHAVDENFDWGQASGGMEMFCRYFRALAAEP